MVEIYTADGTPTTLEYSGFFGSGAFGEGVFGDDSDDSLTVSYASETSTTVSFTEG